MGVDTVSKYLARLRFSSPRPNVLGFVVMRVFALLCFNLHRLCQIDAVCRKERDESSPAKPAATMAGLRRQMTAASTLEAFMCTLVGHLASYAEKLHSEELNGSAERLRREARLGGNAAAIAAAAAAARAAAAAIEGAAGPQRAAQAAAGRYGVGRAVPRGERSPKKPKRHRVRAWSTKAELVSFRTGVDAEHRHFAVCLDERPWCVLCHLTNKRQGRRTTQQCDSCAVPLSKVCWPLWHRRTNL